MTARRPWLCRAGASVPAALALLLACAAPLAQTVGTGPPEAAAPRIPSSAEMAGQDATNAMADAAEVARIERLAATDRAAAHDAAARAKARLEAERGGRQAAAAGLRQAGEWAGLAAAAEAEAARNRQRAVEALTAAADPSLDAAAREDRLRQAEFWQEQAARDTRLAAERRAEEAQVRLDAAGRTDGLDALIARLDAVIRASDPDSEQDSAPDSAPGPSGRTVATDGGDPVPHPEAAGTLPDYLGIWRPDPDPDRVMAIVQRAPGDPRSLDLELHSGERVWSGRFLPGTGAGMRMTFSYAPRAEEMNPAIPRWAREEVQGELVWRLEASAPGDGRQGRLTFAFFPGRVAGYREEPGSARVEGAGEPRQFEAGQDLVIASSQSAPTLLFVSLANQPHDPSLKSIEGITRGTPLRVNVLMSSASAREAGSTIEVAVRSRTGGATGLSLSRQRVTEDGYVVYGHDGYVTIGGDGADREFAAFSAPPRRVVGWIMSALGVGELPPGARLAVLPDSGDEVEFRFGEAYQRFPVHATWVQRALAQYDSQIDTMAATYGGILAADRPRPEREAARERLRMLANYQVLRRSDRLTDLHRLAIAEAYLGHPAGRQLLDFGSDRLAEIAATFRRGSALQGEADLVSPQSWLAICGEMSSLAYARSLEAPGLADGEEADAEQVGEAIQRAALDFLGHRGIAAAEALADDGLDWVHPLERDCIDRVVVRASRNLLGRSLKDYARGLMFGLYEGVAMASGADDIAIAFFGTDLHGNEVPQYSIPWWISTVAVAGEIVGVLDLAVDAGRRGPGPDIWRAAARDPPAEGNWSRALRDRMAVPAFRHVPATPGSNTARRTTIGRAGQKTVDLPEPVDAALDLPPTLTAPQRRQAYTELTSVEAAMKGRRPLAGSPRIPDQLGSAGRLSSGGAGIPDTAAQINPKTGVINWYGADAKARGRMPATFCQIDGEHGCEGVSAAYIVYRTEKQLLSEEKVHFGILQAFIQRNRGRGLTDWELYDEFARGLYGRDRGYLADDVALFLRGRGYEVHTYNPARSGRIGLEKLAAMIDQGWDLRVGIRQPSQARGGHAVVLRSMTRNKAGGIEAVEFFCPTQGGLLEMKADRFRKWLIQDIDYSTIYAVRKAGAVAQ